jgi:hypothetical protein
MFSEVHIQDPACPPPHRGRRMAYALPQYRAGVLTLSLGVSALLVFSLPGEWVGTT